MFDFQKRIERLRGAMKAWGADFLFLNPGKEWYYFSGAHIPDYHAELKVPGDWVSGILIPLDKDPVLAVYEVSAEGIAAETWISDVRVLPALQDPRQFYDQLLAEFSPDGKTIAVAKTVWSETLLGLQQATPNARFISATAAMLDQVRQIKDEQEIRIMREAAAITDRAMEAIFNQLRIGMTVRDVWNEVHYQFLKAGSERMSFKPGVTNVPLGGSLADSKPGHKLEPGTVLAFDIGAVYQEYCTDFGRSFFVGEPSSLAVDCYASLAKATTSLMEVMGDGNMTVEQAAGFVARSIAGDGFGSYHAHPGLGHGIGLDVHEAPWVFPGFQDKILKGMCLAIEPKIHVPQQFYMRIEDDVLVGDTCTEFLTRFPYDIRVIE